MTRADKIRQSATAKKPLLAEDVDRRVILRGRRFIRQDSLIDLVGGGADLYGVPFENDYE